MSSCPPPHPSPYCTTHFSLLSGYEEMPEQSRAIITSPCWAAANWVWNRDTRTSILPIFAPRSPMWIHSLATSFKIDSVRHAPDIPHGSSARFLPIAYPSSGYLNWVNSVVCHKTFRFFYTFVCIAWKESYDCSMAINSFEIVSFSNGLKCIFNCKCAHLCHFVCVI